ncbi:MAG: hypothetical protein U0841_22810 [Chloroflexia bacterium]
MPAMARPSAGRSHPTSSAVGSSSHRLHVPRKGQECRRNLRVAALFSDPTASGRSDDDPLVLVQGLAEVFDQDIQRNTERYIDQL